MNTVIAEPIQAPTITPIQGDLFTSPDTTVHMLVAHPNGGYSAVNLTSGNSWAPVSGSPEEAVNGLTFYRRNARIQIS